MRISRAELSGRASSAQEDSIVLYAGPVWRSNLPWPALSAGAAVLSALAGWLISLGFCLLGWLGVLEVSLRITAHLATQGWLLAHGVSIDLPGGRLSIAPLGYTLLLLLITSGLAGVVGRQVHAVDLSVAERRAWALRIGGLFGVVYGVLVAFIAGGTEGLGGFGRAILWATLIGLAGGLVGAARAVGWRIRGELVRVGWPRWLDAAPRAILGGLGLIVGAAAAVVAIALLTYQSRVIALHEALRPDAIGGSLLLLGQLAWLPNVIAWAIAWVVGSGISFGTETIISPVANQVGMVPAIPMLGAIPPAGPGPRIALLWFVAVAAAGAASALVLLSAQARDREARELGVARPDLTTLVGGVVGIVTGLLACALAWVAGGDLGQFRLVDIGARWPATLIMLPTGTGLAGLVTGLTYGLVRYRRPHTPRLGA